MRHIPANIIRRFNRLHALAVGQEGQPEGERARERMEQLLAKWPGIEEAATYSRMASEINLDDDEDDLGNDHAPTGRARGREKTPSEALGGGGSWTVVQSLLAGIGMDNMAVGWRAAKQTLAFLQEHPEIADTILGFSAGSGSDPESDEAYFDKLDASVVWSEISTAKRTVSKRRGRKRYVTLHFHVPESVWLKLVEGEGDSLDVERALALADFLFTAYDRAEDEDEDED